MKKTTRNAIIGYSVIAVFLLPVGIYFYKFHGPLSDAHEAWSSAGSYFGGVYAIFLNIFTLTILYRQFVLQRQFEKFQYDQAFLSKARADLEFYLNLLNEDIKINLQKSIAVYSLGQDFLGLYNYLNDQKSNTPQKKLKVNIHQGVVGRIYSSWLSVYGILYSLSESKDKLYQQEAVLAKSKIIAVLSFSTAVAVERFVILQTDGQAVDKRFFDDER